MRILSKREIPAFYDGANSYRLEANRANKFYLRTSCLPKALKDLIEDEVVIENDHQIITKKTDLATLRPILSELSDVFVAEIEEEL